MSKLSETPSAKMPEDFRARAPVILATELTLDDRRTLLRIAHDAILSVLERRSFPDPDPDAPPPQSELSEPRGVFTTLYLPSDLADDFSFQLRGCVGYALPIAPLYRAVAETARAAAFDDSRFPPVTKNEAARLKVSLSVLSPLFPVHPDAVEVGRHGLFISDGLRRGLLLPQVPVEHGWDRETFLEQTCRKAGLSLDAWRNAAVIEAFTAEVFADADFEAAR